MATTTTITKLLIRRGNDADRKQTILASGEPGWTLDTKRLWIGDGITPGGIPALDPRTDHLHYIDTIPGDGGQRWTTKETHDLGGKQYLDLNIPGLADTLFGATGVGDDNQKWFHAANADISTNYDLIFGSARTADAEIRHDGAGQFKIYKSNQTNTPDNQINIGDAIFIKPNGNVVIVAPELNVDNADTIFTGVEATHFSDKTIDINVLYNDPGMKNEPKDPGYGVDSYGAGFYISHNNYLSAGYMRVGAVDDYENMSTLEFAPPVYYHNWEGRENDGYAKNTTGRKLPAGQATFTWDWQGTINQYQPGQTDANNNPSTHISSKPIKIQSVRPKAGSYDYRGKSYDGDAHLVFESGLIVYDAGDTTTGAYNAYKINQSVDSRATPTFAGLKIEDQDGNPGAPIPVYSGGTGVDNFTRGSVLFTTGKHTDAMAVSPDRPDELQAMPIEQGDLIVGTNTKGVVKSKLNTSDWITIDYSEGSSSGMNGRADGVIKVNNTFAPDYLRNNLATRLKWFAKFSSWTTDSGQIDATGTSGDDPSELVTIRGDWTDSYGGRIRTTTFDREVNNRGVEVTHNNLASELYDLGAGEFDLNFARADGTQAIQVQTVFAGGTSTNRVLDTLIPVSDNVTGQNIPSSANNTGMVIGAVTIDSAGHTIGLRSKNLDLRYPQLFDMGTGGYGTDKQSPGDFASVVHDPAESTNAESFISNASQRSSSYSATTNALTQITFNDYGTIKSYGTTNLHNIFYDKTQIGSMVDTIDGRLDGHDTDIASLGDNSFMRNVKSWSTAKIATGWFSGSEIQFSHDSYTTTRKNNKIFATNGDWHFKPHTDSSVSHYMAVNKHHEWRLMTSQTTDVDDVDGNATNKLMSLEANSSGDPIFKLYKNDGTSTGVEFKGDGFRWYNGTSAVTTLNNNGISTTTLNSTSVNTTNLKVGLDTSGNLSGSYIQFVNDSDNDVNQLSFWPATRSGGGAGLNASLKGTEFWTVEIDGVHRELVHVANFYDEDLKAYDSDRLGGNPASDYATKNYGTNTFAPKSHAHGNITSDGRIGSQSDRFLFTGVNGLIGTKAATDFASSGHNHDNRYLRLTGTVAGGEITGPVTFKNTYLTLTGANSKIECYGVIKSTNNDIIAYSSSDRNLKDNLTPIPDALDKTLSLTGYEFDWNNKQNTYTGHDVGVVAQEVEQVLPEIVDTREDGTKAVKYEKLVPLLIESIKELSSRVEQLESQLK